MGADQIGHLFKGPADLDISEDTIARAIAHAKEVAAAIEKEQKEPSAEGELPDILSHINPDFIEFLSIDDPEDVVDNLLEWWVNGSRDACCRRDPDDRTQVFGFAGGMSWGDAPDGYGYKTMDAASILDILGIFGIR